MIVIGYSGFLIAGQPMYKTVVLLSVPIFAFGLVEGFENSKDRRKYIYRLWMMSLLIQVLYTLAMDTFNLNGMFGLIVSYFIIDRLEKGEWYWLHTVVIFVLFLPIEYGFISVVLSTLYYIIKHREVYKNKLILIYFFLFLIFPIFIMKQIGYIVDIFIIFILAHIFINNVNKATKKKVHYLLLIMSYLIIVAIRFFVVSYK